MLFEQQIYGIFFKLTLWSDVFLGKSLVSDENHSLLIYFVALRSNPPIINRRERRLFFGLLVTVYA